MSAITALVLVQARRDRIMLPVWILGIAFLGYAVTSAVATEFADEAERTSIIMVAAASPAFRFVRGLPDGSGIGAVVFFQGYAFTAVLAGLMGTFLVIRHTRTDEELGRAELIESVPIPRVAPLTATLLLGAAANLVLAACVAAGFAAAGLPGSGAITAGAAVGAVGVFFVAVAAGIAQVMPSGRAANGAAAGLVGAAYFLRGIGDALGTPDADLTRVTSGWVSLFSPIGWGQRSRPFTAGDLRRCWSWPRLPPPWPLPCWWSEAVGIWAPACCPNVQAASMPAPGAPRSLAWRGANRPPPCLVGASSQPCSVASPAASGPWSVTSLAATTHSGS
jgi:ABC-2 type transport system permease protein